MSANLILLTGAAIISLVFGSIGAAVVLPEEQSPGAEAPARQNAHVYGVVNAIEGEELALATPVGSVSLVTDANTRFRIPGEERPSLGDLAAGDRVVAAGWWEQDDPIFHAFGVARPANDDQVFPLPGKLVDVGDATLAVETGRGTAVVHVDDDTAYRLRGVAEPGLDDLDEGMRVAVRGTLNADGSLQARVIAASQDEPRPRRMQGEVIDVEGDTFTMRGAQGRHVTVLTDEATEFRVPGVENPTIADLHAGDRVAGEGVIEDGVIEESDTRPAQPVARARLVLVLPEDVARLAGKVSAVDETAITLNTRGGPVRVLVDEDTVWRIPGIEEAALSNIAVGDHIVAAGTWQDAATFHAVGIRLPDGRRKGQPGKVGGRAVRVDADGLVIGTIAGPVAVCVDDETRIHVPGIEHPSLDDVGIGALVGAGGTWNEDGKLQARTLAVAGDREMRPAPKRP